MVTMTGKKPQKVPQQARKAFADNVKRLMDERFKQHPNKPKALAERAGVTLSTIQRAISTEYAPTIDTIEAIAIAFGLQPYQLLIGGLDAKNPQSVHDDSLPARVFVKSPNAA